MLNNELNQDQRNSFVYNKSSDAVQLAPRILYCVHLIKKN